MRDADRQPGEVMTAALDAGEYAPLPAADELGRRMVQAARAAAAIELIERARAAGGAASEMSRERAGG